jgi:hypothetical protein
LTVAKQAALTRATRMVRESILQVVTGLFKVWDLILCL